MSIAYVLDNYSFQTTNIQFTQCVLTAGRLKAMLTQRNVKWIQLKDFW
jgi:hypothetical protein